MSSSGTDFVRGAIEVAERAIAFEKQRNYPVSIYFYNEACHLLERAIQEENNNPHCHQWEAKAKEYMERIQNLVAVAEEENREAEKKTTTKSPEEMLVEKAKFLMIQALEADESENNEDAVKLYTAAVEFCLDARNRKGITSEIFERLTKVSKQALERAEVLKGIQVNTETPIIETRDCEAQNRNKVTQRRAASSSGHPIPPPEPSLSSPLRISSPEDTKSGNFYSEEEKQVLLTTSEINGISYLPFLTVDLKERFTYSFNFEDPDGLLKLSPKQQQQFRRWSRPHELFSQPHIIQHIDSFSIKQTLVSDCSMIASLAISANYEKRFGKKLIRSIIYPQNRAGEPIVNPSGKYMVILMLNGVRRKVIIDDRFPTGANNQLLCSYSNNKGELWVSLLEKAYLKVMGGYDFPGSNSNIDLHALTGWIPERRSIANDTEKEKTFTMLLNKMNAGHVLVTVATGDISEQVADRAGLVPTHAYAVLDVREVNGVKLLLLKNPWSHLRWRGNYSEIDAVHWTPKMKELLNYNPNNAQLFDNGVFWIDYESICKFFDVFYMSWNPDLFQYTYCYHRTWSHTSGPVKDVYSIGENPQYSLETNSGGNEAAVWILLTRHITEITDFKDNREYITVLVYENDGKKVYYPNDPDPLIDSVRINSPHYLCKLVTPKGIPTNRYTLVISQYEKTATIHYTLRVYASCPFKLGEILNNCKHRKQIIGEWDQKTAGGCANYPLSTMNNPCYRLELKQDGKLIVDLKGPKEFNVGFDIICANSNRSSDDGGGSSAAGAFFKKSSGPYRPGFVVLDLGIIPAGVYNIIPSTFQPGCVGPFFLNLQSTSSFNVSLVPS